VSDHRHDAAPAAALRLAAIVEWSDDAIVSKDLNGIVTSWNRGAERLFGYTAAEMIGRSITTIIPQDRLGEETMVLDRIRRGESVEHFDTIRRAKDGTPVSISLTVSPIRDDSGVVVGASKIARDISDRKRADAEVADLQSRLLTLAYASASILGSPDAGAVLSKTIGLAREVFAADAYAVWRADAAGTWHIARSYGISEEFAARVVATNREQPVPATVPFSEPLPIEDIDATPLVAEMRDAYRREGIASMIVYPLVIGEARSGTIVFYARQRRTFRPIDVQVGGVLANLAAAALTTVELYEAQRAGREAADHARQQAMFLAEAGSVLGASLDYMATLKSLAQLAVPTIADWCVVDMIGEDGTLQRLGVAHVDPAKVELARSLEQKYPEPADARGGVREVLRTGKPAFMERIPKAMLEAAARDDEHRRILNELNLTSYMCVPIVLQGKTLGAITFVSAESGRQYSNDDLRFAMELASRASLAIDNARAYAAANDASRVKDEFLATLSHELRTPLNAVLGYARMLRLQTLPPDKVAPALEIVERNATSLKQIIEDVLDVSRIISGRLRLSVEPVDLPQILRESGATMMPAADAKGLRLEVIIDPLTTPVFGDPDRLQQIVWNLLSNAIKFTPRGGKVQLRLARVNSHVEIAVSDTGRGITPDFLPHVFERFRQADATLSREHGGLGLGLAIAKQLTELHGGTIAVSSGGEGQGATFIVKLPLMIVHGDETVRDQPRADRQMPALSPAPRLDGIHVLAVDDEADSLQLVRAALEGAGATVTACGSWEQALDVLRRDTPDVMLADIGMPTMDGLQLIRAVRQMTGPSGMVPAAALTAYARAQDRIASLASGFQLHLSKPVDPLELIVAVGTLANRRRLEPRR